MKRMLWVFGCAALSVTASAWAGPRDALWKQVDEAVKKGLPKTAITNLEPIIAGALQDKAYAEALKAIAKKIALEGNIQGNKPEERITRLETEIAKAPAEMKPLMDTLLAHWYWHYFQQNRWRFMQRTLTAEPPGKDFTTWDLPRLFAEIDKQFRKALAAEKFLKAAPVGEWSDLLEKGTMPDNYRPTLYDFIANEALEFYTSGEQAAAKPQDAFELSAESPALDSADKFLAWHATFNTKEFPDSPIIKALDLFGRLMAFHKTDADPTAFLDVDLERLTYAWNTAFGEDKNARYKAALKAFVDKWADHEVSALALCHWARVLQQDGDLVEARRLALQGAQSYPDSPGGRLCRNLVAEIESKSASITTERVWQCRAGVSPAQGGADEAKDRRDACPTLTIRYRNVDAVYFRAIPMDWEMFLAKRRNRPENLTEKEKREILGKPPALEWSTNLPPTKDYKEKSFTIAAPTTLKPGFYFIAASHDPQFGEKDNIVSMTDVWVSDLALVLRTRDGRIEGFVLEAGSGEPVPGARVDVWHLDNNGNRIADPQQTTDENGFFSLTPEQNRGYLFRVRRGGQELASAGDLWVYDWQQRRQQEEPRQQTVFFTDRAIYRPGQTIQYKGICLEVNQSTDNYEVLKGEQLTVVFYDVNGKEVARATHGANDYGSFAGSFTAPRDRLMGRMRIEAQGRASGTAWFSVEEYKRPKFEVTLDAPQTAAKLNEKVSLTGHATSYTGAAVDGATVKYRVVRQVRWPWWWGWWRGGGRGSDAQEIAHGTLQTGTDGSFKVEFMAKPDPKIPEKDEPTFVFSMNADVTDTAGETRSAERSVRVGYTALEAMMSAADWQVQDIPVELKLSTKTLDGEPQVAEGNVKIYELKAPDHVQRASLAGMNYWRGRGENEDEEQKDLSNPNNWPLGKVVAEHGFTTDTNGNATLSFELGAGAYRAVLETQDRFGKKVTGRLPLQVLAPEAPRPAIKIPHFFAAPEWSIEPGQEFMALWGTGYDEGRAFVEIEHRHQMIRRYWTKPGQTQQQIQVAVTEAMRGGFTVHVTQVRENRAYLDSRKVNVPWDNKDLELHWEHFTSKLQPGQKETWTCVVKKRSDGVVEKWGEGRAATNTPTLQYSNTPERLVAEMVATLYDESLDAFLPLSWPHRFNVFREDYSTAQPQFMNFTMNFQRAFGRWARDFEIVQITYRHFPYDLTQRLWGYRYFRQKGMVVTALAGARVPTEESAAMTGMPMMGAVPATPPAGSEALDIKKADQLAYQPYFDQNGREKAAGLAGRGTPQLDLSKVTARKNLNETAFFYPQLTSDSSGVVRMTFTMPEALTKWHFLGFAHDRPLRSGFLEGHAFTAKDLMVQPNPPRFLREGDTVEFTVKVSNQSDQRQTGQVRLSFADAAGRAGSPLPADGAHGVRRPTETDELLGNTKPELDFDIPAKESRTFSWRITVPDGAPFLTYKAVAATASLSDGEEGAVPVLSRRIFVTESLPLWIRGPATKRFEFKKLAESGKSKTLQHQGLTVQMVSHPAWYAVMALPYLMEFPYECSEQMFNRLYANALARHIANSDAKIRRIFDQWKNTPALDSPLEKNQDLKSVILEETPWLRQAQSESQARRNVGILFDDNRLNYEADATLRKLAEMQLEDGRWPWFPGGPGNDYITLYIVTGFGRLRHLGVDMDVSPAVRAVQRLDAWMTEHYDHIQKHWTKPEDYVPSPTDALYLYGRSFFLKDQPIAPADKKAVDFFLGQARKHWLKTDNRQTQGHLAIALKRFNTSTGLNNSTPTDILKSIKERSVTSEEMGMFWRDTELSWWWYRAPIETQALMIEAFDEIMGDDAAVEECRVWLLNQKRTQDWKTTKATADAVYGLLRRGKDILTSGTLVEVKLGGVDVTPKADQIRNPKSEIRNPIEPGTGFYEVRFTGPEVKPKMGEITVKKIDEGLAWGGVHWQYLEDMSKVTPYEGTPLKLKKSLFTKVNTARGPVLEPVKGPLAVGDELVVRIELRVDRDMEYVHMKDQRGSGTEPVNVISRYKYQDGLAYYESTRDTASHFFIDYLPKGTYVFEYSTRIQLRGQYQTGVTSIQCMYAPEFNSHSESYALVVK